MSEKVTFQELIDSIAEQTDNSKKFTHDFIKDFVSVINSGLEKDSKVNIAGLGKFELRHMEEREGYNPETEEKITIPAHNKIVFKPYKDLRELVNAPYAGMEPTLLEEEPPAGEESQEDVKEGAETPEDKVEDKEISTEQKVEDPGGEEEQAPWQTEETTEASEKPVEEEEPFDFTDKEPKEERSDLEETGEKVESRQEAESVTEEKDDDIVEFEAAETEQQEEQVEEEPPSPLSGIIDDAGTEQQKETPEKQELELEEEEPEPVAQEEDLSSQPEPPSGYTPPVSDNGASSKRIWITAAAIGVAALILGLWFFMADTGQEATDQQIAQQQEQPVENQQPQEPATRETNDNQPPEDNTPVQQATQADNKPPSGSDEAVSYTVREGQTLWGLANRNYEDPYLWPWIYDANKAVIANPDIITVGQSLMIPQPDGSEGGLTSSDSLEVAIGYVATYRWYKDHGQENAKYYLWAAKMYDDGVFDHIDTPIDKDDLAFANRVR